jgi:large subunit ribosomal protein L17
MALGYRRLGRNSAQRKALLRDLITDLIINEKIETTYHKAKELQRLADKMVTLGKANTLSSRVKAAQMIRFEFVDEKKEQYAIQKLFSDIALRYKERKGGYTRVLKLVPRLGDSAPMAIIEFV